MSIPNWPDLIYPVKDGENVNALVEGRPIQTLVQRTDYLKSRLDLLDPSFGRLTIPNVTLKSSVAVGDWVYYDYDSLAYDKAIAEISQDSSTGFFTISKRAYVAGVVIAKSTATSGDILVSGRFNFVEAGLPFSGMVENPILTPFSSGRYFLSRKTAGKMTRYPSGPSIQLGYFSNKDSLVALLAKDLFESHFHYVFDLVAKPAASQNYSRTGWSSSFATVETGTKIVDYFNRNSAGDPPAIIATIRQNPALVLDSTPLRVDLYRNNQNKLAYQLTSGTGLDYNNPQSSGATTVSGAMDWPVYGQYVTIPGTALQVAFLRYDGVYNANLQADTNSLLTQNTDRYKIFLPNDLGGWVNANKFDPNTPPGVKYSYLVGSQKALDNVFPPQPPESAALYNNGTVLAAGTDFKITLAGIYWIPATFTADLTYSPWPHDYITDGTVLSVGYAKNISISFIVNSFSSSKTVVNSLSSRTPAVIITDCVTGQPAARGDLAVDLDLNLSKDLSEPIISDTAFIDVHGVNLQSGSHVAELTEGSNIKIIKLNGPDTGHKIGKLEISAVNLNFSGEVTSIALLNAKEEILNGVVYIDFLKPTVTKTAIAGSVKIPEGIDDGSLKLGIRGKFIGDSAVASITADQTAVFKIDYYINRAGTNLQNGSIYRTDYWIVGFNNYTSFTLQSAVPIAPSGTPNFFKLLAPNIQAGDKVSFIITRVVSGNGTDDNYSGKVGLVDLNWTIDI